MDDALALFLANPDARLSIRETARLMRINPMTARAGLSRLEKQEYVRKEKGDVYPVFVALKETRQFRNAKLYWTLERLRKSGLLEAIDGHYDLPVTILFGSCARGTDIKTSDLDLCVISDVKRPFPTQKYEKSTGHPVSLHVFSEREWERLRKANNSLRRNIQAGITLSDTVAP
jgi:DNA-binding Lrp family transcriptional regulator